MAVLDPLRVVITNYDADLSEVIEAPYYPHDVPLEGSREVPFSRELWIERADFEEHPPKGFRRLVPGGQVRLRYAYVINCDEVVKDDAGNVVELRCTYDPETRGGSTPDGRRVKGTIQWVAADTALSAEVRLFERLFVDGAGDGADETTILDLVNPQSLVVVRGAKVEPSVADDPVDTRYQFERTGYFWRDPVDGGADGLVFNRIVALKDTWAKREASARDESAEPAEVEKVSRPAGSSKPKPARRPAPRLDDLEVRARFERYRGELGVSQEHAEVLADSADWAGFFEAALAESDDAPGLAVWVVNDLRGLLGGRELSDLRFSGVEVGRLAALVEKAQVTRRAAKDVLTRMVDEGGDPADLVESMGLNVVDDPEELAEIVEAVLADWPDKVTEYRAGKKGLIGLFVGETMKRTRGAADPETVKSLLATHLES
jgi:glutaminyl-tRNA synthetase